MTVTAGIDYSMTCPAICVYDTKKEFKFDNCSFFFYNAKTKFNKSFNNIHGFIHLPFESAQERYDNISEWAMMILNKYKVTSVCLEGYAMGASKGLVFNIAENGGLLKHKMWKAGIPFIMPAPTQVKKTFTGKGNAKKEEMYAALVSKGLDVDLEKLLDCKAKDGPLADIVDSFAMVDFLINSKE